MVLAVRAAQTNKRKKLLITLLIVTLACAFVLPRRQVLRVLAQVPRRPAARQVYYPHHGDRVLGSQATSSSASTS